MLKSASVLLGSNVGLALLKLLRNVLLARLLTVENFGIASTFAVVFSLFEMLGYLGLDRLLVQTRDGEAPRFQASLHTIQILRGGVLALALVASAGPMAELMGVPEITWAFRLMAVFPLLQGLAHLDQTRMQRAMRFAPFIRVMLGAEILTLLSIYPLYLAFGDYRVALYAALLQYGLVVVLSHLLAERGYRLGFDRSVIVRAIQFGWPLLLNAALLFAIFQGDRIIVANRLGVVDLGLFSLAFMLTLMAANILSQTQQTLFLPKLSPLQDDPEAFQTMAVIIVESGLVIGLAVATGFALLGPDLILIVFGEKYAGALSILVWLAVMHAIRIAKSGIAVVAMARGRTLVSAATNILRVLLLPVAWLIVGQGGELVMVVWLAALGELVGLAVALVLLRGWLNVRLEPLATPLLLWAACLSLVCLDTFLRPSEPAIAANFHWFQLILLAAPLGVVFAMRDLRNWLITGLGRG